MLSATNTIVLDLDGPLLDGMFRHYRCYSDILADLGRQPVPVDIYWKMKRDRVSRRTLLELTDSLPFYDDFLGMWLQRIELKEYLSLDRIQNGVKDILAAWKDDKKRLILATMRNHSENLFWQLNSFGLAGYFDEVVVIGSSGKGKASEVAPFLAKTDLKQALWIGDTEMDVVAAKELGMKICALKCGLRNEAYLSSLSPDFLEDDIYSFYESWKEDHAG